MIKKLIVFTVCLLLLSTIAFADGKWVPVKSPGRLGYFDICFADKNNGWIVGSAYGDERLILHTSDGGRTWQRQSKKGKWAQFLYVNRGCSFVDSQNGWIVGDKGLILHTLTGGLVWQKQDSGLKPLNVRGFKMPIDLFSVQFTDKNNGWAVGALGTIIHTENGGITWERQRSGTTQILWDIHCIDRNNCWAVGSRGTILHTTNGGEKWLGLFRGWKKQESNTWAHLYGVYFIDKDNGWVVGNGGIFNTSNGGKTWQTQARFRKTDLYKVFFVNKDKGWAVGWNLKSPKGVIKYTEDGGKTWLSQESGTIYSLSSVYFIDEDKGFAVGEHTILRYVGDNETGK